MAELQVVAYNLRSLILINEGKLSNYGNFSTKSDYVTYLQTNVDTALSSMY